MHLFSTFAKTGHFYATDGSALIITMGTLSQFVHPVLHIGKAGFVGQVKAVNGRHGPAIEHLTEIGKFILARGIPKWIDIRLTLLVGRV